MDFLTFCGVLAGYLTLLAAGGLITGHVLSHITPLMRYIDRLPMMEEERHNED